MARFYFKLTIPWSLSTVMGNNRIINDKKYREIAGHFDGHADVAVQCGVHCLMEHILGFISSHWMPPSDKCLRGIALAAAMANKFIAKHQTILSWTPYIKCLSSCMMWICIWILHHTTTVICAGSDSDQESQL